MDLQGADVEQAAVEAEGARRVQLEDDLGEAVVVGAAADAAGGVAEDFTGFLNGERDAVGAELGAQAEEVAEQEVGAFEVAEDAGVALAAVGVVVAGNGDGEGRRRGACSVGAREDAPRLKTVKRRKALARTAPRRTAVPKAYTNRINPPPVRLPILTPRTGEGVLNENASQTQELD